MAKRKFFLWTAILFLSCKLPADRDRKMEGHEKLYHLRLQPLAGSKYRYTISSQTTIQTEIAGKKLERVSGSEVQVSYEIEPDNSGNFLFRFHYEDLKMFSINKDSENENVQDGGLGYEKLVDHA